MGIRPLPEALQIAREDELDLVEIAPQATPPVCKIMDYGKWKFETAQRAKESRRKSTNVPIKQMNYRIKIGPGDFDTKTRKVIEFLTEGHKVKVMVWFKGRETSHPHLGMKIMDQIAEKVAPVGKVEAAPKLEGRNMIMVIAPDKRAQAASAKAKHKADSAPGASDSSANGAPAATTAGAAAQPTAQEE